MRSHKKLLASLASILVLPSLCYWTIYDIVGRSSGGSGGNRWTLQLSDETASQQQQQQRQDPSALDFDGFDNVTGSTFGGRLIAPNVIHYIRFNKTSFSFVDYVCLRSAYVRQRPERIYIHSNVPGGADNFTGTYWERVRDEPDLYSRIRVQHVDLPSDVFGQPLSDGWRLFHGSDVARIRTMMQYGGIYLDNDVYVVHNLDKYRKFEIAMGWDEGQFLGSQVIVAHRNARFLPMWLDTYRQYRSDLWYYNAGERPTTEVLQKRPNLIHRVKLRFGVHMLMHELYDKSNWHDWSRDYDAVHLLINHRSYLDPHYKQYPEFNEINIQSYPFTFGDMARQVLVSQLEPETKKDNTTLLPSS